MSKKKRSHGQETLLRQSLTKLENALVRLDTVRETIRNVVTDDEDRALLFSTEKSDTTQRQVH